MAEMKNISIPEGKKLVPPDCGKMAFMGRISFRDPKAPEFYWAGSNVRMRFTGTSVKAALFNKRFYNDMSLGFILDGREGRADFGSPEEYEGEYLIDIAEGLEEGEHEIILFKRQDATHYFSFFGFVIDGNGEVLDAPVLPDRKIECFGDSVSAGAVVEAMDCVASPDPENNGGNFDNAWHSYAAITARNLGAQLHCTAQGGIAVFDNTGYYHAPDYIGMETAYNKLCYFPEGPEGYTDWDLGEYIPSLVIFAVGQNDQHNEAEGDPDITDPAFRRKWKERYKDIIKDLREKYGRPYFVLLLTVLNHGPEWDDALDEIVEELSDERISHLRFTRVGRATPGHPRLSEQYEMASELTAYISRLGDKVWAQ
ncbi:MAG: electron transporter RnfD [Ruminococcus sp.]|nr:electron transporter RnfD [Ruminococcus sp.]